MLVNASAARLLRDADRGLLLDHVAGGFKDAAEITFEDGRTMVIRTEAVIDAGRTIGAVIRLGPRPSDDVRDEPRRTGPGRPVHGWSSLSDTERTVAGLVAEGLTNREAAARLVLSPHTIDFHLRHVFGKLDVTSRVELTRVVLRNHGLGLDA
jgi:DNA-binding CsgD family transcriptional regulator